MTSNYYEIFNVWTDARFLFLDFLAHLFDYDDGLYYGRGMKATKKLFYSHRKITSIALRKWFSFVQPIAF